MGEQAGEVMKMMSGGQAELPTDGPPPETVEWINSLSPEEREMAISQLVALLDRGNISENSGAI